MRIYNVKTSRIRLCTFCSYWYDPTDSAIVPSDIRSGFWNYDENAVKKCENNGCDMKGGISCHMFECKMQ